MAIPTVKGEKSPSERFAGADSTYTIEALMQNGWALQSGTSHFLGQNFARAFDVFFQTEKETRELVWATSWGVSTRLIGALVMTHSDDKGLVLPPRVSPIQVVIVPIVTASAGKDEPIIMKVKELEQSLKKAGIRVKIDDRSTIRPGAKYFEWERKGVPIRLEIGARDLEKNVVTMAIRYNGEKTTVAISDINQSTVVLKEKLDEIHNALYKQASDRLSSKTFHVKSYEEMKKMIEAAAEGDKDQAGFYMVPWKCNKENEAFIKEDCKATIRCYPADHNKVPPAAGVKCFYSGDQATHMAIFARAF